MKTITFFLTVALTVNQLLVASPSDRLSDFMVWLLCSRQSYQKHVDVYAYILDREQVADLLADPCNIQPIQKTRAELADQQQYLVFRIDNRGDYVVWGTLAFYLDGKYLLRSNVLDAWDSTIPIEYDVIPIGRSITNADDELPKVKVRWKSVYVE